MTRRSVQNADNPLHGVRVLVTRPRDDAEVFWAHLRCLGAEVMCLPTIAIRPLTASSEVTAVLDRLDDFDWIGFTSRNAVRAVFEWLETQGRHVARTVKVAAIGSATARELRIRGVVPNCVPTEPSSLALAAALIADGIDGRAVLLPLGSLARDDALHALERAGAQVTAVRVYETVPVEFADPDVQDALVRSDIDVVALASPSAFQSLLNLSDGMMREPLRRMQLVAIGPTTARAIRDAGYTPKAVAKTQTTEGMVAAIVDLYSQEQ
jgi:uroporphyrinogen-III synthase